MLTHYERVAQFNQEELQKELDEMFSKSPTYDFSKVQYIEPSEDQKQRVLAKFDTGCSTRMRSRTPSKVGLKYLK
jgi:hypothetical protein